MNVGRLVGAAIAATVTDAVYGFLVYGMLLQSEFDRYPNVYRPNDAPPMYLATMFLGILVAMFAVTYIYAKGYEGGSGIAEGARFGILFGIFAAAFFGGVSYGTLNVGRKIVVFMACAGLVEWTLNGIVIGLVYKSAPRAGRAAPPAV
ncbi:MAG TPA: hypothetical protein VGY57_07410 [Vicinamibacterales bacterium]|jgi:hypothetical protein|nr:hypothetical protein [Vicinamibacterales bacterium]